MNNVAFGSKTFSHYETIGGGSGAGPGYHGTGGVQVHMTNTRITDIEIIEDRFPIFIDRFELRRYSGGTGEFRGGDGLIRVYGFGAPCHVSVVSQRRGDYRPYGKSGGGSGMPGMNRLIRRNGAIEILGGRVQRDVEPGDILEIHTPGGGGYGTPGDQA